MPHLCKNLRHSFTTRLVYTVVPSEYYAAGTIDCLHRALADDVMKLYEEGLEVTCMHSWREATS